MRDMFLLTEKEFEIFMALSERLTDKELYEALDFKGFSEIIQ